MSRSNMTKRLDFAYETRKSGATTKSSIMNYDGKEVEFFTPLEGKNRINILPYTISTKKHPLVANKRGYEIGESDYNLDIFVHRGVGVNQSNVICLNKTYGKACPICEARLELLKDESKKAEAEALKPKRRVIYNVEDLNDEGKVKIFDVSHFLFEKELIEEAKEESKGMGILNFCDEEEGYEVKFRANEVQKSSKIKYFEFKSFGFDEREEPLSPKLLKQVINLDECLNVPTYDEVKDILYGNDDDEEDETPVKPSKKEEEVEEVRKPSKKSRYEDEESDERPSKRKLGDDEEDKYESFGKSKNTRSKLDDDEEDEPVRPSKKRRHYEEDEEEPIF